MYASVHLFKQLINHFILDLDGQSVYFGLIWPTLQLLSGKIKRNKTKMTDFGPFLTCRIKFDSQVDAARLFCKISTDWIRPIGKSRRFLKPKKKVCTGMCLSPGCTLSDPNTQSPSHLAVHQDIWWLEVKMDQGRGSPVEVGHAPCNLQPDEAQLFERKRWKAVDGRVDAMRPATRETHTEEFLGL